MVVFNYLPKSYEVSNTTIIANSSDKSMDLVKYFYLLHFCHSLLPFYIAPCTGRKKAAAQCFVQRLFRQYRTIYNARRVCSAHKQRNHYLIFRVCRTLRSATNAFFHKRGCEDKRQFSVNHDPPDKKMPRAHAEGILNRLFALIPTRSAGRIPPAAPAQGRGS